MNVLKALVAVVALFAGLTFTQCGSSDDKVIKEAAEQMNDMCPMEMGGGVRMDKVAAEAGKKLNITMTVSTIDAGSQEAQMFTSMGKPMLAQAMKANNNPEFKGVKDMGVIFIFDIYDRNGESIQKIEVTPDDYK